MTRTVFLVCGETGAGKNFLVDMLCEQHGFIKGEDFIVTDYDGVSQRLESQEDDVRYVSIYINVPRQDRQYRAVLLRGDDIAEYHDKSIEEHAQYMVMKRNADFDYSVRNDDWRKALKVLSAIIYVELDKGE